LALLLGDCLDGVYRNIMAINYNKANLTIMVISENEEKNIRRCLESVVGFAESIIIVDSSTDTTPDICKHYTKNIFTYKGITYEDKCNYGIEKAFTDWVLAVDADEVLTPEIKKEILELDLNNTEFNGFRACFRQFLINRTVNDATIPAAIRLYKNTSRYVSTVPHAPMEVYGKVGVLKNYILHFSHPTINDFIRKTNNYSDHEAKELFEKGKRMSWLRLLGKPINAFYLSYFKTKRYKYGVSGFIYSLLIANYSFMMGLKLYWLSLPDDKKKPEADVAEFFDDYHYGI